MKVILLENLAKIGSIGEIIDVKRGFARNYLILNKKALYASKENIREVEKIKTELNKKDQEKKKNAKQIYESLKNKVYEVKKLTTENKDLYGSIKPTEISKIINQSDKIDVKPSLIQPLNEIKTLGTFKVRINLHSEVQAEINIKVISEDNIK
tara:strand:- start:824 stop:1282 length:459 start_codon:yes stop_codon:yes gene_type:complete